MTDIMDDQELLGEYTQRRSQDAFRELVDRHLPMVYSVAQRVVGNAHLAEEVAQGVFVALAQKAASLAPQQILAGWLYHTARYQALHAARTEQRRREREQVAVVMQTIEHEAETAPVLDQLEPAMAQLGEDDRDALVLRYLEARSLSEVGHQFGISEDAARMRVNRALEHLRSVFAERGITVASVLLATVLTVSTTSAVPAGLAASITATALAGTVAATAVATAFHSTTAAASWVSAKALAATLGAVLLGSSATYLIQQRQIVRMRVQNGVLLVRQQELNAEVENASQQRQSAQEELQRLQRDNTELIRLRNEVGQLRRQQSALNQRTNNTSPSGVTWSLDPKALAQNPPVVLIRPSPEQSGPSAVGMVSSEHRTISLGTHLSNVIAYAYGLGPGQVQQVIMPPEASQEHFDFLDTLHEGGREAMQRLLTEQFGLVAKRETRLVQSLELTMNNSNAPGLTLSRQTDGGGGQSGPGQPDDQAAARQDRIQGEGMLLAGLAAQLAAQLGRPVIDQTGLTDKYNYELSFKAGASLDEIKRTLLDQLGLDLVPGEQKQPAEFLVVEKVQQP